VPPQIDHGDVVKYATPILGIQLPGCVAELAAVLNVVKTCRSGVAVFVNHIH
jgi:hypothetical protein